jgi:hypothetical protein
MTAVTAAAAAVAAAVDTNNLIRFNKIWVVGYSQADRMYMLMSIKGRAKTGSSLLGFKFLRNISKRRKQA